MARSHQGQGLGSRMMSELEARLKPMGVTELILYTARGKATSGFYQRRGFEECTHMLLMHKTL